MTIVEKLQALKLSWAHAVVNKNVNALLALYTDTATLKPTMSNIVRSDLVGIKKYFCGAPDTQDPGFLNQGIINVEFKDSFEVEAGNIITSAGIYEFTMPDRKITKVHYTFVCRLEPDDSLRIIAHHSSFFVE